MGEWPNHASWLALQEGDLRVDDDEEWRLFVVDCGELVVPSGKLVACDPFAAMRRGGNPYVRVPPGRYPVRVTLADVSGQKDGSHIREAYASLLLAPEVETSREVLSLLPEGQEPPELEPGEFVGFQVDAGTACFVDDEALVRGMPDEMTWLKDLFENERSDCWFAIMDDPSHVREGLANIPLPLARMRPVRPVLRN
jgi:hypothetical protein